MNQSSRGLKKITSDFDINKIINSCRYICSLGEDWHMIIVYNEFKLTGINLWKIFTYEKRKKCMDIYTKSASLILIN